MTGRGPLAEKRLTGGYPTRLLYTTDAAGASVRVDSGRDRERASGRHAREAEEAGEEEEESAEAGAGE